ncbi:pseudouridine synthase [Nonomuraea dietziae]|uniref:pseudouridine synthase n=1 Tax=Nonomuraea dietziae TaxID=65515 RepID=UPI0034430D83
MINRRSTPSGDGRGRGRTGGSRGGNPRGGASGRPAFRSDDRRDSRRDDNRGGPRRDDFGGAPRRDDTGGASRRDDFGGASRRDDFGGGARREGSGGGARRDDFRGGARRDDSRGDFGPGRDSLRADRSGSRARYGKPAGPGRDDRGGQGGGFRGGAERGGFRGGAERGGAGGGFREDRGGQGGFQRGAGQGGGFRDDRGSGQGGYRGGQGERGSQGGYRGGQGERGGQGGFRGGQGERGGYGRSGDERGGYRGASDRPGGGRGAGERGGDRGGFRERRDFGGARQDRGGYGDSRGFRDDRATSGDDREGYRGAQSGRDDRGGYRGGQPQRDDRGAPAYRDDRGGQGSRDDRSGLKADRGGRRDDGSRARYGRREEPQTIGRPAPKRSEPAGRTGRVQTIGGGAKGKKDVFKTSRQPMRDRDFFPDGYTDERDTTEVPGGVRLQKVLAQAGVASRRACEEMIGDGRVTVNGQVVRRFGAKVDPAAQVIHVDGKRIPTAPDLVYYALNKPIGVVSTMEDPQGRPCLADFTQELAPRLFHVGRLDTETEGLLLLTNDGELANRLTHPSYGVQKKYWAKVPGPIPRDLARRLRKGIELEDGLAKADHFEIVQEHGQQALVEIVLHEGRNHIVRRMLEEAGHRVIDLARIEFGPVKLGRTKPGTIRALSLKEVGDLYAAVKL